MDIRNGQLHSRLRDRLCPACGRSKVILITFVWEFSWVHLRLRLFLVNIFFSTCTLGARHIQTRLVEPSAKSLNSGDVFILVTPKEMHLWNGRDASIMKKAKVSSR